MRYGEEVLEAIFEEIATYRFYISESKKKLMKDYLCQKICEKVRACKRNLGRSSDR